MEFIYNFNALPFLNKRDLLLKDYLVKRIELDVQDILREQNKSWQFVQIEAPCLIPQEYINQNYTEDDIWLQQSKNHAPLALKPETTPSSYLYLEHLLKQQQALPPLCVWQVSKSFRREQDQPLNIADIKNSINKNFNAFILKIQKITIKSLLLNH